MRLQLQPTTPSAALNAVYARERAALAPECAGVFGRQGLFVGGDAELAGHMATPMLGRRIGLRVLSAHRLGGDTVCEPGDLPFADDSFRLVVVQHAFERVADPAALRDEIVRVLEPGGIAIVIGFARYGVSRAWLAWQGRGAEAPRFASAASSRRALSRCGVDVYAERRVGHAPFAAGGLRFDVPPALQPSWMLIARKRSAAALARTLPVALRPRPVRANLASGTQRASA